MNETATDSMRTRVSLLERVKDLDDARSWSEFFQTYENLVCSYARRRGLREHEVDDVAQEVFKRIARTIHEFHHAAHPGSFRSWLRRLTGWRAEDRLRERAHLPDSVPLSDERTTPLVERIAAPPDPALEFEAEARQHLLAELFRHLENKVSPRHLQIFQLLVVEDMPAEHVARLFSMSLSNLYVLRHRVMEKLRAEAKRVPLAWD